MIALMLSCACPIVGAACVQHTDPDPPAAIGTTEPTAVLDAPDGEDEEVSLATLGQCLDAGRRGPEAREAFCRSLPDPSRGSCWSKVHSRIAWDIWCAITFSA
jgi:hypothetical protein